MTGIRIAIAAGGTAGHVIPALAVAEALRARDASVFFIGGHRAERELVPAAGYEIVQIVVEGLDRGNPVRAARALARAARATGQARRLLGHGAARAVMGGGGYVAGPASLAAVTMGLPIVLTEADSRLGLTNRALAPLARRVCLAFPIEGRHGPRYLVTGRPGPAATAQRMASRRGLGISPETLCLLIYGGSLGARSINEAALEAFAATAPGHVLHVAGTRDYAQLAARPRGGHYDLREYLPAERFGEALAASDLVVARSGGSIFEVAAYGRPAILIPYPHAAGDHQARNAAWMEQAGAAVVIADRDLSGERLRACVQQLLGDGQRLARMAEVSAGLARPDAARLVADELLRAAGVE